jgi:hypothetical protein
MPPINPVLLSEARILAAYLIFVGSTASRQSDGNTAKHVGMLIPKKQLS